MCSHLQAAARDAASKALAPATALLDDRLYVFEAVGLLLGQEEVPAEQQLAALSALLQPLTAQVGDECTCVCVYTCATVCTQGTCVFHHVHMWVLLHACVCV